MNGLSPEFLAWTKSSTDIVVHHLPFVDMAGEDLHAGLLLSHLMYWYLPATNGTSRLRYFRDGYYWVASKREDWWERCRLTPEQYDRAIQVLIDDGLVVKAHYRFAGTRQTALRVVTERFLERWDEVTSRPEPAQPHQCSRPGIGENTIPESVNPPLPYTETTNNRRSGAECKSGAGSKRRRPESGVEIGEHPEPPDSQADGAERGWSAMRAAVAESIFGIDPDCCSVVPEAVARIADIVAESGEGPESIPRFAEWYTRITRGYTLPRKEEKFRAHWARWLTQQRKTRPLSPALAKLATTTLS